MYNWLSDFIHNREHIVAVGDQQSRRVRFQAGVPQGSVLGSLLFSLYFDCCCRTISTSIKFADDVCITAGSVVNIHRAGSDFHYNVPATDFHRFETNNIVKMELSQFDLELKAGMNFFMLGSGANGYIGMDEITPPASPAERRGALNRCFPTRLRRSPAGTGSRPWG